MADSPDRWRRQLALHKALQTAGEAVSIAALAAGGHGRPEQVRAELTRLRDELGLPLVLEGDQVRLEARDQPRYLFDWESLLASGAATFRKRHPPAVD